MAQTLQQRMIYYEESTSTKIISRIPIIIKIDGRSFARATKNVQKPFCERTMAALNGTMLALVKQIDGAVFGYQYSDKIIIIVRNDRNDDETPWFGNDVQSISSTSASITTYEFMNQLWEINNPPNLEGSINFKVKVFGVPNISEVINYIIYKQYCCMQYAIDQTVYYILGGNSPLEGIGIDERKRILDNAGVSLDEYPASFHHGSAAYMVPKLIHTEQGEITRHKWLLDVNVPLFVNTKDRDMLRSIIKTGSDIWRPERDL